MTEPLVAQGGVKEPPSLENIFHRTPDGVDYKDVYLEKLNLTTEVDKTVKEIGSYLSEVAAAAICTYKPGANFDLSLPEQILMQIDDLMEHYKNNEHFNNSFLPEFSKHQQNFRALRQLMSKPSEPVFSDTEQIPEVLQKAAVLAESYKENQKGISSIDAKISSLDAAISKLNVQSPQSSTDGGANNIKIKSLEKQKKELVEILEKEKQELPKFREFTGLLKPRPVVVSMGKDVVQSIAPPSARGLDRVVSNILNEEKDTKEVKRTIEDTLQNVQLKLPDEFSKLKEELTTTQQAIGQIPT